MHTYCRFSARLGFPRQSKETLHTTKTQSCWWDSGTAAHMAAALVTHKQFLQSFQQTTQVLGETQPGPQPRAGGPTYEAGLLACTQGAVGRVVTGLRREERAQGQT